MKPEDILDALGQLDDKIILDAREKPKSKKAYIYSAAAIAATFLILAGTVFNPAFRLAGSANPENAVDKSPGAEAEAEGEIIYGSSNGKGDDATVSQGTTDKFHSSVAGSISVYPIPEATEEEKAFAVFYVSGGEIEKAEHTVTNSPYALFEKWKEMHGIAGDVELLDFSASVAPSTETYYYQGECIVEHTSDGIMRLNITVSKSISDYYDVFGEEELISALKNTLEGYTGRHFDEISFTEK